MALLLCAMLLLCATGMWAQGNTGATDGVAEDVRKPMKKDGWLSFKIGEVSMDYPKTWELDESGKMMTTFILFAPVDDENDLFMENVNLLKQDLAEYGMEALSLEQYIDLTLAQLPTYVNGFELIGSEERTSNGLTYHELVYKGEQGVFALQFKQRIYLQNGVAYILTFTAEEERYAAYDQLSTELLGAFTIAQ